ncbi:MAG: hypothetical protein PF489_06590 [Salinivirgaceae bacterium]|jgi:hypothetical protein|nr:hypothetical protein [Salinivirgaceae bacterium]
MKNYLSIIFLLLIIQKGHSQNTYTDDKNAIKIYNLTTFESSSSKLRSDSASFSLYSSNSISEYFHPTFAYQWKSKKNNFHEIELTNFILKNNKSKDEIINDSSGTKHTKISSRTTMILISFRYEYILNFNKSKDTRFVPSLGFGVRPFYKQEDIKFDVSTSFPSSEKYIGFSTYITPRLTYYVSSKLFLDINIPLNIFSMNYNTTLLDNPAIPKEHRDVSSLNFEELTNVFSARIGVGLKL